MNVKAVSPAHTAMTWNYHPKEFIERGCRRLQVLEHHLLAHSQCCVTHQGAPPSAITRPQEVAIWGAFSNYSLWNTTALWEKVPLQSYSDTWSQNIKWWQTSWPRSTGDHRREAGCTHGTEKDTSFICLSFQGDSVLQVYKPGDKMLCVKHRNEQCHLRRSPIWRDGSISPWLTLKYSMTNAF